MQANQAPTKFPVLWGAAAPGADINYPVPVPSQIGVLAGKASFTDGFPPITFTAPGSGGVAPFGADFNGILKMLTAACQWQQTGAYFPWDSGFAASIGGYQSGAIVASANANTPGVLFISLVDNNLDNPDLVNGSTGLYISTKWQPTSASGASTGDLKPTFKTVADAGWLMLNDQTIGSAASGATYASADAFMLFCVFWTVNATYAPMFTSAGAPIARGANAVTDWNNNRRLQLCSSLGRALCVAGAGAGLTARALGQNLGAETFTLGLNDIPNHEHVALINDPQHAHAPAAPCQNFVASAGTPGFQSISIQTASVAWWAASTTANAATGVRVWDGATLDRTAGVVGYTGQTSPSQMQPSVFVNMMVKK